MICPDCGENNYDYARRCASCGALFMEERPAAPYPYGPAQGGAGPEYPVQPAGAYGYQPIPTHLALAIVSIIVCWPPGIAAVVFSTQVNGKLAIGDYHGALQASKNAKTWALVGIIGFVLPIVLYLLFALALLFIALIAGAAGA